MDFDDLLRRVLRGRFLLVNESLIWATVPGRAATALRDKEFRTVLETIRSYNDREREWLFARCRQAAPQTLIVPT